MEKGKLKKIQKSAAVIIFLLAIIRLFNIENLNNLMDDTFILLLFVSIIVFLIPLDKISRLKAGGVEIELFESKVANAVSGIDKKEIENELLKNEILKRSEIIESIKGSRILWIDDTPLSVLGERRVFRALGFEIHSANNKEVALELLDRDIDFDLIISDIQWLSNPDDRNSVFYGGIELCREIKQRYDKMPISKVKTIFYTSYEIDQIKIIQNQTDFSTIDNVTICYTIIELFITVINSLKEINEKPIKVPSQKRTFYRNIDSL